MLNKLLSAAFILVSTNAFAGETYTKHTIELTGAKAAVVTLSTVVETTDGCNTFGLSGKFLGLQLPADEWRLYTPYVAEFSVSQTQMGCDDLPQPRKIPLSVEQTFQGMKNQNISGVFLDLLVPSNLDVSVRPLN